MPRVLMRVGLVLILTVSAWALGAAQGRFTPADFYISVEAPVGQIRVTCTKGCDWRNDPQGDVATNSLIYRCSSGPCRLTFNGNGRILVDQGR
jgi:hypothetical protein